MIAELVLDDVNCLKAVTDEQRQSNFKKANMIFKFGDESAGIIKRIRIERQYQALFCREIFGHWLLHKRINAVVDDEPY